jgi:hypothetical protein
MVGSAVWPWSATDLGEAMKSRVMPVQVAVGLVVTLSVGAATAVAPSSGATACVNNKGVLALRTHRGGCPHGYRKTTIGVTITPVGGALPVHRAPRSTPS